MAKTTDKTDTTPQRRSYLERAASRYKDELRPPAKTDKTIDAALRAFPGSSFEGVYPPGEFQGPMLPVHRRRRCPRCGGERHFRGGKGCALCAEGGPAAIAGERLEAVLRVDPKKK